VAPNGIMYAKHHVRQGLLGRMLKELLQTRVMVKQSMKGAKDDKVSHGSLSSRQALSSPILGFEEGIGCSAIGTEVHQQCHIWVYQRYIFGTDACSGNCRQYCSDRT
jgi:hypothetical protein